MAPVNGTRKSADRTFREETVERVATLETQHDGLKERIEGAQIALGSRIDDLERALMDRLDSHAKALLGQVQSAQREFSQNVGRIDAAALEHAKELKSLDQWYNRRAGAAAAYGSICAVVVAIIYAAVKVVFH